MIQMEMGLSLKKKIGIFPFLPIKTFVCRKSKETFLKEGSPKDKSNQNQNNSGGSGDSKKNGDNELVYKDKGKKKYSPYLTNKDLLPGKRDQAFEFKQNVVSPKRVATNDTDFFNIQAKPFAIKNQAKEVNFSVFL